MGACANTCVGNNFTCRLVAAYIALEQYDKAMEDADECVRLQPSWAKGYLRRGSVYFRMGQLEQVDAFVRESGPRPFVQRLRAPFSISAPRFRRSWSLRKGWIWILGMMR